jgi:hypothetical protein
MANDRSDKKNGQRASVEGKLAWVNPEISIFAAREAEATGNPYGGIDAGIYHS